MYEKPELNRIGLASEVVLGMGYDGFDLDYTWNGPGGEEFAADMTAAADTE